MEWRMSLTGICLRKAGNSNLRGNRRGTNGEGSLWNDVKSHLNSSVLEILRRRPDNDLVDFHLVRLLDGVSDRACDRVCRNGHFVKLVQVLSGRLLRAAFR